MAQFIWVTPKDRTSPHLINLDAVREIEVVPAAALPPLESTAPLSFDYIGSTNLVWMDHSQPPMQLAERFEDIDELMSKPGQPQDKTMKLADDRQKALDKLSADRQKEREKDAAEKAKAEHAKVDAAAKEQTKSRATRKEQTKSRATRAARK